VACTMYLVYAAPSWLHVTFTPVNVPQGGSSVITITMGSANVVTGGGSDIANVSFGCGGPASPEIPMAVSDEPMPEPPCPNGGGCPRVGKPVDVTTGEEFYQKTDLAFSGPFGITFRRTYGTLTVGTTVISGVTVGPTDLGAANCQSNYDAYVHYDNLAQYHQYDFHDEDGQIHYFRDPGAGNSKFNQNSGMTLAVSSDSSQLTVTSWDNRQWVFNGAGLLTSLRDRAGNTQTIVRDPTAGNNNRILSVTDPLGRALCFYYDGSNRITTLAWENTGACPGTAPTSGTITTLTYDVGTNCATGQLCSVTEPGGQTWRYQYASGDPSLPNGLTAVIDPNGNYTEETAYAGGQVSQQWSGNCSTFPCADTGNDLSFSYPSNGSNVTTVTDGEGRQTAFTYDINSYLIDQISGPLCQCGGDQTRTYTYDGNERLLTMSDDGVDGSTTHTFSLSYGRDQYYVAVYPQPTQVVENLDSSGTTRTTTYQYYPVGDPRQDLPQVTTVSSIDSPGSTMSITDTYQTNGTLTSRAITGFVNGTTTTKTWNWSYDAKARLLSETDPKQIVDRRLSYFPDTDSVGNRRGQPQASTDALGHVTSFAAYPGYSDYTPFGAAQSETDPNGVVTEYTFNPRGVLNSTTLLGVSGDPQNLVTTMGLDDADRVLQVTYPAGNGLQIGYDTSDRTTTLTRIDASSKQHERIAVAYNYNDQQTMLSAQTCPSPAAACPSWSTTWSAAYGYSPTTADLIKITNADNTYRQFGYINSGFLSSYNDENHTSGSNYAYGYDLAGRRLSETRKLGSGSVVAKYAYDLHDNINAVTDENGNTTTYHYDDFDRVTKEVSPVQGTTTYAYDSDDNLTSMTDSDGATTTYTYDALDRELTENAVEGSQTLSSSWSYDDATAGHYGIGRLATMTDPSGSTTYTYERRGNIASEAKSIIGNAFSQLYAYDANGNRTSMTYPDGSIVAYTFDYADRPYSAQQAGTMSMAVLRQKAYRSPLLHAATPESRRVPAPGLRFEAPILRSGPGLRAPAGASLARPSPERPTAGGASGRSRAAIAPQIAGTVFVSSATYQPFGPIASIAYGNGTTQTFSYNNRYFPTANALVGGASLASYAYTEDAVGNITAINDTLNSGYNRTFAYDDLNRLTTATSGLNLWGSLPPGNGYTYDAMGNIKSLQLGLTRTDTFAYIGTLPKLSSVTENTITTRAVTYDTFGNRTSDGKSTFTYSSRELLASDSRYISTYYYNGFRQRVATQLSSNGDYRDSLFNPESQLLSETAQFASGTPSIAYDYIWFGDRPVAQTDSTGTHWTFADHLGTPLAQTSSAAAITWQAEYEPYGNVWTDRVGSTVHQPLRFPGQTSEQFDSGANGLTERSYNNARWYQADWGRYTQADPNRLAGGTNEFQYANDDPTRIVDPTGLQAELACADLIEAPPLFAACVAVVEATKAAAARAAARAAAGAAAGAAAVSVGASCRLRGCKPCVPPVGTLMYRGPDIGGRNHFNKPVDVRYFPGYGFQPGYQGLPHYNYYVVRQVPYPECRGYKEDSKLAAPPPPVPGSVPVQEPTGGGPI